MVRATSVTLRLTATAEENSTVPKNIVNIGGTIMANSTATLARPSRTKRRNLTERETLDHDVRS